ncbi:zf-HC2 domain-containing protein [Streptomyces sp. NPDC001843]|uniref:zf-HC2 domain-containing protein n=1 Tax=Streptomyces sp. NPDC001843 TaxID=3364617 RepID=UPI0036BCD740
MTSRSPRESHPPGPSPHVPETVLRAYAAGRLDSPGLARTDTHLASCTGCRRRLVADGDRARTDAGWARLDAAKDVPQPGLIERALVRLRVPDHTARLISATPALRRSWLTGTLLTLLLALVVARLGHAVSATLPFLVVAPALPVAGVAASFGPRVDPMYEMTLVAPLHGLRLLLPRTLTVVATALVPAVATAVAMPGPALHAFGWLLPSLALTALTLALSVRLDPVVSAGTVGGAWTCCVLLAFRPVLDFLPSVAGQLCAAAVLSTAAFAIAAMRTRYALAVPGH